MSPSYFSLFGNKSEHPGRKGSRRKRILFENPKYLPRGGGEIGDIFTETLNVLHVTYLAIVIFPSILN